jgi:competence protein ComEC
MVFLSPGADNISGYARPEGDDVFLFGTVKGLPEFRDGQYGKRVKFQFSVKRCLKNQDERPVSGTILADLFTSEAKPRTGDILVIGGRISSLPQRNNPGEFDYGVHLRRAGMNAVMFLSEKDHYLKTGEEKSPVSGMLRFLGAARNSAHDIFEKYLKKDIKAITSSAVLGLRGGLADETEDIFINTGTMHILAVSGLHVGIAALIFFWILRLAGCPRKVTYVLAAIGVFAFAVFTGGRSSSMRAAFMAMFAFFGAMSGRKTDVINALVVSAMAITFFYPGQLLTAGFILSYTAVAAIVYISPVTDDLLGIRPLTGGGKKRAGVRHYFIKTFSISSAVWIGMMPIVARYFYVITPFYYRYFRRGAFFCRNVRRVPFLGFMDIRGSGNGDHASS